jgi:hypothetical protein
MQPSFSSCLVLFPALGLLQVHTSHNYESHSRRVDARTAMSEERPDGGAADVSLKIFAISAVVMSSKRDA